MKVFEDFGKFVAHMATIEAAVVLHAERGLKKSAVVVEKAAKAELGTYQQAAGPFPAWAPLAEATQAERARLGFTPDDPLLRDGTLIRDSIKHEVAGHEAVIGSTEEVAAYQEFGTNRIPPRPFMGPAIFHSKKKIEKIMGRGLVTAIVGGASVFGEGEE